MSDGWDPPLRHPAYEWRSGAFPRRPGGSVAPIAITVPPPKRERWHAAVILAIALGGTLALVFMHGVLVHLGGTTGEVARAGATPPTETIPTAVEATLVEPIETEDEAPAGFDMGVASFILSRAAKRAALVCELRGGPSEAKLAVTFARDGTVTNADVLDDWSDTTIGRCFAGELRGTKIVPFEGEPTELRFTLQLY